MSQEHQSPNFAAEYIKSAAQTKILLCSLLAVAILSNAFLVWKIIDLNRDLSSMGTTLNQTQKTLLEKDEEVQKDKDKLVERSTSKLIQNLYGLDKRSADRFAHLEVKYSKQYGIPLHIGLAITAKESGFRMGLTSVNGCCEGPKQVSPFWWGELFNVTRQELRTDLDKNIESGYRALSVNLQRTGSMSAAIAAYQGTGDAVLDTQYAAAVVAISKRFDIGVG